MQFVLRTIHNINRTNNRSFLVKFSILMIYLDYFTGAVTQGASSVRQQAYNKDKHFVLLVIDDPQNDWYL